jgi:Terminase RNaseH-like domain
VVSVSTARRAKAAAVRRSGGTQQQSADAAKVSIRTYQRWELDNAFLAMIQGRGVWQSGPIAITTDDAATIDTDQNESVMWVAIGRTTREARGDTPAGTYIPPEVLGKLLVKDAPLLKVVFVMPADADAVRVQIENRIFPLTPDAKTAVLPAAPALQSLQDEDDLRSVCRLFCAPQRDAFSEWCRLWKFRAGETRDVRTLELWEGQQSLADALCSEPHVYALKGRKTGFTELSICYAAFVVRVRDVNAKVGLYSYRERSANDLLAKVRFGLDSLPPHLRLPFAKEPTLKTLDFLAGTDDIRSVQSFPTSQNTSIEATFTHVFLDEFAFWPAIETTFGRLTPTFNAPGATSELCSTGAGPAAWASDYWRRCKDAEGIHVGVFYPASARPGRSAEWLQQQRKGMTKAAFRREYAETEDDALAGAEGAYFQSEDVDEMVSTFTGEEILQRIEANEYRKQKDMFAGARLISGVDLGVKDATVIVTLAILRNGIMCVVKFERYTGLTYPEIQARIEQRSRDFPRAPIVIEANSMGATVIGNLKSPAWQIVPFTTTQVSKARIIEGLSSALENQLLKAHPDDCPALFSELRAYAVPDTYVVQDAVMATAIAIDQAAIVYSQGILHTPFHA